LKSVKRKHRITVYRKYKDSNHPARRQASRKACIDVKRAKYHFEKKLAENIKKDTRCFYAYVKGKAKTARNIGPLINEYGEVVDSPQEMCEEFNKFFGSVFTKEKLGDNLEADLVYKGNDSGICDILITEVIVVKKLDRLRDDKASGADDLVPRFLKRMKHEIKTPLALLFRKILDEGVVPMDWKEANVIPIHKGGHRNTASNYRPISLTSQLCKVFEAIVRDEVVHFLEKNKLIKDSQHGLRKGNSCLTNLLLFLDKILHSVDEGYCVDVVFLDLAKTFDKVPHQRLLEKLN